MADLGNLTLTSELKERLAAGRPGAASLAEGSSHDHQPVLVDIRKAPEIGEGRRLTELDLPLDWTEQQKLLAG